MTTPLIIDAHVQVFPDPMKSPLARFQWPVGQARLSARTWLKPFMHGVHRAQPLIRHLPDGLRWGLEQSHSLLPVAGLLIEGTLGDLQDALDAAHAKHALVAAQPPYASNEFVLELASEDRRLVPVVNLGGNHSRPHAALKRYVRKGAKALKVHPAADGLGPDNPHYQALLKAAQELGLPVILHTGRIRSLLLNRKPALGDARLYRRWFEQHPGLRFVLAHMNYDEPNEALELLEKFPNLWTDTSWQPAETIGEAVRRVGAERVLFGSDWPFLGDNIRVGLERIQEAIDISVLKDDQAQLILGRNAAKLFGLGDEGGNLNAS